MALKYKVGDRVKIKSLDWYNKNKDYNDGAVYFRKAITFVESMSKYCGQVATIIKVTGGIEYKIDLDNGYYSWTDEMIECKVAEETKPEPKFNIGDIVYSKTWQRNVVIMEALPDGFYKVGEYGTGWFKEHEDNLLKEKITLPTDSHSTKPFKQEISLPEGYQFVDDGGNVINATKIVLEKKKKEYPKTYEECCTVLRFHYDHYLTYDDEKDINPTKEEEEFVDLMDVFSRLIVCRNAYWKLYGEEIGLGKPWAPDWDNVSDKYCIYFVSGYAWSKQCQTRQCPFAFPTAEMRDDFKKNFDPDLEICKELL